MRFIIGLIIGIFIGHTFSGFIKTFPTEVVIDRLEKGRELMK